MTQRDAKVEPTAAGPETEDRMVSYAQNAEDVVLARLFSGATGFYVDVGASDPDIASVTRHFYDRGWHGINIEMRPDAIEALNRARPRDINLQIAVGDREGIAVMHYVIDDPDQSFVTFEVDRAVADEPGSSTSEVAVRTLDVVLEEHQVGGIDFLKIDVEGAEREVLQGIDLRRWRPTVVVIEAVQPWSNVRTDHEWRNLLIDAGYIEGLFDGLNLYFLAKEHEPLLPLLLPANVVDGYETAETRALREHQHELEHYVKTLEAEISDLTSHQREIAEHIRGLEAQINGVPREIARSGARPRPPGEPRLAILGTPRSGNTWIRRLLSDSVGLVEIPVHHPADVDWEGLPDRFVLQLHWPRTMHLSQLLAQHRIRALSIARHPLDAVLSMMKFAQRDPGVRNWLGPDDSEAVLAGCTPGDDAFVEWAVSDRVRRLLALTPDWWDDPSTIRVRYEDAVADPLGTLDGLLDVLSLEPRADTHAVVNGNDPARIHEMSGGVHVWQARGGLHRELLSQEVSARLTEAHRGVIAQLGYSTDPAVAPDADAAQRAWQALA